VLKRKSASPVRSVLRGPLHFVILHGSNVVNRSSVVEDCCPFKNYTGWCNRHFDTDFLLLNIENHVTAYTCLYTCHVRKVVMESAAGETGEGIN
jgi:hypothetical protein